MNRKEKIVIIGSGMVGMSCAYSLVNQGIGDELVIIDINESKAKGESLDLAHGLSFCPRKMTINYGDYSQCNDANVIVITAGVNQQEGETRLDLLRRNADIMKSIVRHIKKTSFNGVIVVATNPVDVLTNIVYLESGFPYERVIGSGTLLDTARLRFELSKKLNVDPKIIHAYILGEHGDSEFMCFSNAYVSVKPLIEIINDNLLNADDVKEIVDNVKNAAYEIINLKGATCYAIGMALARLIKAIIDDEKTIMPVSTYIDNEYKGVDKVYLGVPAIIGHNGVEGLLNIHLSHSEEELLANCARIIKDNVNKAI